jgi:hypothetical protein
MDESQVDDLKQTIITEFDVMEDDIYVNSDNDAMTFYIPTQQFEDSEDVLDTEIKVLEEHEYELLVRVDI